MIDENVNIDEIVKMLYYTRTDNCVRDGLRAEARKGGNMKNGMVYANGQLVDSIRVRDDYTLDDYCDECKINGCAWEGNLYIEWFPDEEVEQISPSDHAADDTLANNDFFDYLTHDEKSIWEAFPGQAVES